MKYEQCVILPKKKYGNLAAILQNLLQLIGVLFLSDFSANF